MRELLTNSIVAGLSIALLVHFIMIAQKGSFRVVEPNTFILGAEMTMLILFIIFAFWNLSKIIRG